MSDLADEIDDDDATYNDDDDNLYDEEIPLEQYERLCKLQTQLYLSCLAQGVSAVEVRWWGGSDEGNVDVNVLMPNNGAVPYMDDGDVAWRLFQPEMRAARWPPDVTEETLSALENMLEMWFDELFSLNGWDGDGDGVDYGMNITFDIKKGTATYEYWETKQVTVHNASSKTELA